jgi:hypothetical protein
MMIENEKLSQRGPEGEKFGERATIFLKICVKYRPKKTKFPKIGGDYLPLVGTPLI